MNIGRFRDCSPRGDVSFRKLTLLFSENGRGKTTLCVIFRSLQTGLSQYNSEWQTLETKDADLSEIEAINDYSKKYYHDRIVEELAKRISKGEV